MDLFYRLNYIKLIGQFRWFGHVRRMDSVFSLLTMIILLLGGCFGAVDTACEVVVEVDERYGQADEIAIAIVKDIGSGFWQVQVAATITVGVFSYCDYKDDVGAAYHLLFTDQGVPEDGETISGSGDVYSLDGLEDAIEFFVDDDGIITDAAGNVYALF